MLVCDLPQVRTAHNVPGSVSFYSLRALLSETFARTGHGVPAFSPSALRFWKTVSFFFSLFLWVRVCVNGRSDRARVLHLVSRHFLPPGARPKML